MMIRCHHHDYEEGILASQDLAELAEKGLPLVAHRTIRFEYRGEEQGRMVVSEYFSSAENLPQQETLPLPDDYPAWYLKLVVVCGKCFPEK